MVWARRALLKANSELRLNPERPKLKFQKLLVSIKEGRDEYGKFKQFFDLRLRNCTLF